MHYNGQGGKCEYNRSPCTEMVHAGKHNANRMSLVHGMADLGIVLMITLITRGKREGPVGTGCL
jgi:hypothetical protein